jgi:hypothetical protein
MASSQLTGNGIIAIARTLANDDDAAGNYGVSDDKALVLLNDILGRFAHCFSVQPRYYGASITGLTFPAGTTTLLTSASDQWTFDLNGITDAYQTGSSSISTVLADGLPSALERKTVQEVIEMYLRDNQDTPIPQSGSDWEYWAAEREGYATEGTVASDKWRFWVYPTLNRTQHITLKGAEKSKIIHGNHIPNLTSTDANYVARLLAWEMATRLKDTDQLFLQSILSPLPRQLRAELDYGAAVSDSQRQAKVEWSDY